MQCISEVWDSLPVFLEILQTQTLGLNIDKCILRFDTQIRLDNIFWRSIDKEWLYCVSYFSHRHIQLTYFTLTEMRLLITFVLKYNSNSWMYSQQNNVTMINEQNICNTSITCQYKQAKPFYVLFIINYIVHLQQAYVAMHTVKILKASSIQCNTNIVYYNVWNLTAYIFTLLLSTLI